jgi:CubicO group peptidase (beta-lactamase class C family)
MNHNNQFPYESPVEASSVHMNEVLLQRAIHRFKNACSLGIFPGGQMVVRRHGQVVVNESCGIARGYRENEAQSPLLVTPQTVFPAYSIGKPIAAIAIAMLEEQGALHVHQRLRDIIPDFKHTAYEDITIFDVLTHCAGMVVPALSSKLYKEASRDIMLACLTQSKPMYPRGTFAYLPSEFGIVICEVIRCITGQTLADWMIDHIATPLDLPALRFGLAERALNTIAHSYWLGGNKTMLAGFNFAENFENINNSPAMFETHNPAYSLITNAASLAAFFECLVQGGVTHRGQSLLSSKTIQHYTKTHVSGWNKSVRSPMAFGQGFQTGTLLPCSYGYWNTRACFGHGGALSSLAFGDYKKGLSVAIITNGNRSMLEVGQRFMPLSHLLRKACL